MMCLMQLPGFLLMTIHFVLSLQDFVSRHIGQRFIEPQVIQTLAGRYAYHYVIQCTRVTLRSIHQMCFFSCQWLPSKFDWDTEMN